MYRSFFCSFIQLFIARSSVRASNYSSFFCLIVCPFAHPTIHRLFVSSSNYSSNYSLLVRLSIHPTTHCSSDRLINLLFICHATEILIIRSSNYPSFVWSINYSSFVWLFIFHADEILPFQLTSNLSGQYLRHMNSNDCDFSFSENYRLVTPSHNFSTLKKLEILWGRIPKTKGEPCLYEYDINPIKTQYLSHMNSSAVFFLPTKITGWSPHPRISLN